METDRTDAPTHRWQDDPDPARHQGRGVVGRPGQAFHGLVEVKRWIGQVKCTWTRHLVGGWSGKSMTLALVARTCVDFSWTSEVMRLVRFIRYAEELQLIVGSQVKLGCRTFEQQYQDAISEFG